MLYILIRFLCIVIKKKTCGILYIKKPHPFWMDFVFEIVCCCIIKHRFVLSVVRNRRGGVMK